MREAIAGFLASSLILFVTQSTASAQSTVTIRVDSAANRRPINPNIDGVAHATTAQLNDLNAPLHRNGGNNTTRYNWQLNADNRGNDWYYQSIPDTSATAGERGDSIITSSRAAGAQPMLTVPLIEWVAKVGPGRTKLASFSIAKYGPQTGNDWQWFPDAGNGIRTNGQFVTGNDPNDANVQSNVAFQRGWVEHLVNRWGTNANGGLRYYILDNEPSLWHATHRDVRPTGATMDEIRNRMIEFGAMIKAVDPSALVAGPEEWGWSGYLFSGYDQQYGSINGWGFLPDRANHGGADYLPWLLDQLRQNHAATGRRVLDIFTVHYYPQSGEFSEDVSLAMQQRRNRSTRSLWDPSYVDRSWINDRVQLIPRLKNWVSAFYPGTAIGITEYNWGAENHINGATTQADIYGIFGREGLDMGARWTTPATSTPTYKAMKMYRNYDGNKSTFGDVSVAATLPNPDVVSAFAAERSSDRALTVMVINKDLAATAATINLVNVQHRGSAQVWQLTASNAITRLSDTSFSGNSFTSTLPPQSITLFVLPGGLPAPTAPSNLRVVRD
jgi:Glycoside hydrolase family 44